ncbi:hypothetical protein CPC08DRAFT_767488 [Agrocybe pediades]|nr:hypothetical protein CPC08DRAFT_767488 [Agrocybe pediades]
MPASRPTPFTSASDSSVPSTMPPTLIPTSLVSLKLGFLPLTADNVTSMAFLLPHPRPSQGIEFAPLRHRVRELIVLVSYDIEIPTSTSASSRTFRKEDELEKSAHTPPTRKPAPIVPSASPP